jgi:hypothetical protein
MTSIAASRPPVARILPFGTALIALAYIVPALWIVIAPHGFFNTIGPFGTYNGHYLGDAAALQAGIGVALAAAAAYASLRPGALLAALLATGFHTINHWIDVNHAHAGSSAGASDAIQLTILTVLIAGLFKASLWREPTS